MAILTREVEYKEEEKKELEAKSEEAFKDWLREKKALAKKMTRRKQRKADKSRHEISAEEKQERAKKAEQEWLEKKKKEELANIKKQRQLAKQKAGLFGHIKLFYLFLFYTTSFKDFETDSLVKGELTTFIAQNLAAVENQFHFPELWSGIEFSLNFLVEGSAFTSNCRLRCSFATIQVMEFKL